jgi:hypothetical protein
LITEEEIEYFTNPDLIKIIMDNSYNCEDYGKAIAHLCFENEKLSKKIAKILLKGIAALDNF